MPGSDIPFASASTTLPVTGVRRQYPNNTQGTGFLIVKNGLAWRTGNCPGFVGKGRVASAPGIWQVAGP